MRLKGFAFSLHQSCLTHAVRSVDVRTMTQQMPYDFYPAVDNRNAQNSAGRDPTFARRLCIRICTALQKCFSECRMAEQCSEHERCVCAWRTNFGDSIYVCSLFKHCERPLYVSFIGGF